MPSSHGSFVIVCPLKAPIRTKSRTMAPEAATHYATKADDQISRFPGCLCYAPA